MVVVDDDDDVVVVVSPSAILQTKLTIRSTYTLYDCVSLLIANRNNNYYNYSSMGSEEKQSVSYPLISLSNNPEVYVLAAIAVMCLYVSRHAKLAFTRCAPDVGRRSGAPVLRKSST